MFFSVAGEPLLVHLIEESAEGTVYFVNHLSRTLATGWSRRGISYVNRRVKPLRTEDVQAVLQAARDSISCAAEGGLVVPTKDECDAMPRLSWALSVLSDPWVETCPWSIFDGPLVRVDGGFARGHETSIMLITPLGRVHVRGENLSVLLSTLNALHSHPLLGKGSEGLVYKVELDGKPFALKVYDAEAQRRLQESASAKIFGLRFSQPNFLRRVGDSAFFAEAIREVPHRNFDIRAAEDYAFGMEFHLMEFIPDAFSLEQLAPRVGVRTAEVEAWMSRHGVETDECEHLARVFQAISAILELRRYATRWGGTHGGADLNPQNILVTGRGENDRLQLVLIDQGASPVLNDRSGDPMYEFIMLQDQYHYFQKWHGALVQETGFRQFLQRVGLGTYPGPAEIMKLYGF